MASDRTSAVQPVSGAPVTAPETACTERALSFLSGGHRLVGVLAEPGPEVESAEVAAVLVHGWGSYRAGPHAMLIKLARALAESGVPTLRFDLRGRGDSEGDYFETDLDGMIADCVAAGTLVRRETGRDALAAVGLCSGGNVIIGAATLAPEFVKLVPISTLPFQSHKKASQERRRTLAALASYARKLLRPETYGKLFRGEVHFDLVRKAVAGGEGGTEGGRNRKESSRDIVAAFARYPGALLFLYGGADAEGDEGRRHYEAFSREHGIRAAFHVVDGANHNFYSLAWEREVIDETVRFVGAACRAPAST